MPELDAGKRAKLPDSAFAYVASRGQRRLPINDEAHVRNALARFGRIRKEREFCCDEIAASICGDRATYARALAALEQSRGVRLAPAAG